MTAILVLCTFAAFLTIDYIRSRKRVVQPAVLAEPAGTAVLKPQTVVAGGFEIPAHLRYHPGHTWALGESPQRVRVGFDDLAAHLFGAINAIDIPKPGQWIRQGQKFLTVVGEGHRAELVSPIEGEVSSVNNAVVKDPAVARRDPYGEGWLMTVHSPDAKTNFRNLLSGSLAQRWMEEASTRLRVCMSGGAGAFAQDGGRVVDDLAQHLPEEAWNELTHEFFLT